MKLPDREACQDLRAYMASEDNLLFKLRMMWEWHEDDFQRLVEVATRCLREIESDDTIPRFVASFFGDWLHNVNGIMQNPQFIQFNKMRRSEQKTKAYFAKRIEIIYKLVSWMSNGKCPPSTEHFALPEWNASSG